jgi:hypothetical protein
VNGYTDGSSDRALLPILRWTLRRRFGRTFEQNWADLGRLRHRPTKLPDRVRAALDLFPCDLLVVHRDAEREPPHNRVEEIARATDGLPIAVASAVPVHMTEAWLLFDEVAIRTAAGRPNGTATLQLPSLTDVEAMRDPKACLHEALGNASQLSGRRRKDFRPNIFRVAELIDDFSPLQVLPSFRAMVQSLDAAMSRLGVAGS